MSSSSASASHSKWPRLGPVTLGSCPECGRTASLKRRVTTSDKNGNKGREYVKCESKEQPGEDSPPCEHFEWLDAYVKRIQEEGNSLVVASMQNGAWKESGSALATVQNGLQKDELKKMTKQLENLSI